MTRFIFVTGGVVSSLGKGLASASLGALLKARGFKVCLRKLDPYLNVDPGTMNPHQHGEVFVTEDGTEADLDLGHYERFTGVDTVFGDCVTTGKIYLNVIHRERRGDYLGATVQVIPHITDEIKAFVARETKDFDFVICEIGGTVGDIESLPFLEAIRQLRNDWGATKTLFIHVALVPYIPAAGECKSKPVQHSVRELQHAGIQADLLLCRCDRPLSEDIRKKLALFCNMAPQRVIEALDVETIYAVPLAYQKAGLDREVCEYFGLPPLPEPPMDPWEEVVQRVLHPAEGEVTIAIVGKYMDLQDAYKSLGEALTHGGIFHRVRVNLKWIDATLFEDDNNEALLAHELGNVHAILVPGGFGQRGIEGMITVIQYAREKKIPFLGICLGMQLAVIEAARNLGGFPLANSTEFNATTPDPVIALLTEWMKGDDLHYYQAERGLGGTMRLGAYVCLLQEGSKAHEIYDAASISERHRHRYEFNLSYRQKLAETGILFSGLSPDGQLMEIIERPDHPWFVAVQFHPELKSRPLAPHLLFISFIGAALAQERLI